MVMTCMLNVEEKAHCYVVQCRRIVCGQCVADLYIADEGLRAKTSCIQLIKSATYCPQAIRLDMHAYSVFIGVHYLPGSVISSYVLSACFYSGCSHRNLFKTSSPESVCISLLFVSQLRSIGHLSESPP